ncbi:MAG: heme exporter protein CcmD [Alphaproteobacteria bacterium]|nr:heme exporter protein CcmD [Alphaproteobacteria bacterium]
MIAPLFVFAAATPTYGAYVYPAYLAAIVVLGALLIASVRRRARARREAQALPPRGDSA